MSHFNSPEWSDASVVSVNKRETMWPFNTLKDFACMFIGLYLMTVSYIPSAVGGWVQVLWQHWLHWIAQFHPPTHLRNCSILCSIGRWKSNADTQLVKATKGSSNPIFHKSEKPSIDTPALRRKNNNAFWPHRQSPFWVVQCFHFSAEFSFAACHVVDGFSMFHLRCDVL